MNSPISKPRFRQPAVAIGLALLAAALMIVAAWFKRSAAPGSPADQLLEASILTLAVFALFVPYLALPLGPEKNDARSS